MQVWLVLVGGEDLAVSASAVDLLLVLDGELDHQGLALVAEGFEPRGQGIEPGVLAGLKPCVIG